MTAYAQPLRPEAEFEAPAQRRRKPGLAAMALALAAGLTAGVVGQGLVRSGWLSDASSQVASTPADEAAASAELFAPALAPSVAARRPATVAPAAAPTSLQAGLWVAGIHHPASAGEVALPSGTRFQVQAAAGRFGMVSLYAINSQGVSSAQPLWQAPLRPGQSKRSPMLRLEGTRGLETLRLVLRDTNGRTLAQQDVQILHL